jgi:hypothetical protein
VRAGHSWRLTVSKSRPKGRLPLHVARLMTTASAELQDPGPRCQFLHCPLHDRTQPLTLNIIQARFVDLYDG